MGVGGCLLRSLRSLYLNAARSFSLPDSPPSCNQARLALFTAPDSQSHASSLQLALGTVGEQADA